MKPIITQKPFYKIAVLSVAVLCLQATAHATLVAIYNPSFELDVAPPGGVVQAVPAGWTAFNEAGPMDIGSQSASGSDYTVHNPLALSADGNQFCYLNMFTGGVTGGIYQDAGALQPNTTYTLTVAIGSRADRINSPGIISLVNGVDNTGTVLATGGGLPATQNTWGDYTVSFTTGASVSSDLIVVLSVAGNGTTIQADFDNVRLTAIPAVTNFSFEAGGPATSVPPGWTAFNEGGSGDIGSQAASGSDYTVFNPLAPPADGNQFCFINMFNPSVTGGIYQYIGALETNTIYTLTVAIGSRADRINSPGIISLINGTDNTGTILATGGGLPATQNTWQNYTVMYTNGATPGQLSIALSVLGNGSTIQANFDNVRLTATPALTPPPPPPPMTNFSFEEDVAAPGQSVTAVPTGWTAFNQANPGDIGSQNAGGTDYTVFDPLAPPADGNQFCYINMFNPSVTGGIYYHVGTLKTNTVYTMTVAIGSRADRINSPGIISLINGVDNTGTILASGGGLPATQNTWQDYTVSYTNGATTGDLTIALSVIGNGTTIQADFDNVRLTNMPAATPPPPFTVSNPSFEVDAVTNGQVASYVPTGWAAFNQGAPGDIGSEHASGTDYTVFNPLAPPGDGYQFCYINTFNPSVTGGIYQHIGALTSNTVYTLTVAIGSRADRINSPGIVSLINGVNNTGTVLASGGGLPAAQNTWQDYTVTYTTGASVSGDLTIALSVLGNGTTIQADFDNVQLTKAVYVPVPVFGRPKVIGGNLILTASGGTANSGYTLLTTTNLSAPILWTTNSTGTLDGSGAFSNSIPIGAGPARFYRVRVP